MANNFIQMAALDGRAVTYTIIPIFKHIIDYLQLYFTKFQIFIFKYFPLKRQLFLAY